MASGQSQLQLNFAERAVRRRPTSLVLGVMLSVVVFIVLFVSNVIVVNQLSGDIIALSSAQQRVADENQRFRVEIARLQSADRIIAAATSMGMILSDSPAVPLPDAVADTDK